MKRLTKGLLLGFLMLFAIQAIAAMYEDVSPGHWAYGDIVNLTELGILSGIKVGDKLYYQGENPLNRYQAAVLLGKLLRYIDENYQKIGVETATSIPEGITETLNRLEMAIKDDAGNIIQLSEVLEIVKGLQSRVATLENKRVEESVPLPQTAVQDILNKIRAISENISYVRLDISTLNASSTSLEKELAEVTMRLETADLNILGLKEKLGSLENTVAGQSDSLKTLGETIRVTKNELSALSNEVNTLKMKISSLDENMAGFESFKSFITGDLDNLISKVEVLEGNLATLATKEYVDSEIQKNTENVKAYVDSKFVGIATKDELNEIKLNLADLITRSDLSSALKLYVGIDELTKAKESLSASDTELLGEISKTKSEMNARYDELSKSINILGNRIDSFGTIREDVSGLQINFAKVSADLNNLSNDFETLKARYESFELSSDERLGTLESRTEEIGAALNELEGNLMDKLGENFSYFENLMIDVTNLQDKVGAIETALYDVKTVVENDHDTLTKTASDTEALSAEVTNIKSKVSDLEAEVLNVPTKESVNRANDNAVTAIYVGAVGIILGIVGVVLYFVKP
ncbi:hypothetical protein AT15_04550 [Kosmotoga arenicorallina S304]|uniref:SLH domain-containing protein n=1 Tax=Kosmotoga arenicorallina S304 TaxID=1453497 RepID=A0A176JXM2_9BACT|nr:hypothetical protein [Kosmotoga arenicorallina]OAA28476.1 hypothetical protein AT15_04550 [Kosmotoga arenicorallina S304]